MWKKLLSLVSRAVNKPCDHRFDPDQVSDLNKDATQIRCERCDKSFGQISADAPHRFHWIMEGEVTAVKVSHSKQKRS